MSTQLHRFPLGERLSAAAPIVVDHREELSTLPHVKPIALATMTSDLLRLQKGNQASPRSCCQPIATPYHPPLFYWIKHQQPRRFWLLQQYPQKGLYFFPSLYARSR